MFLQSFISFFALCKPTMLNGPDVYFDLEAGGFAERTGWVSASDGLLVRDINNDGLINNGGELFGTSARNGFEVLRALDSNGDNQITRADTDYGSLRIWRDANSDGVSQAGELITLADAGIAGVVANDNVVRVTECAA